MVDKHIICNRVDMILENKNMVLGRTLLPLWNMVVLTALGRCVFVLFPGGCRCTAPGESHCVLACLLHTSYDHIFYAIASVGKKWIIEATSLRACSNQIGVSAALLLLLLQISLVLEYMDGGTLADVLKKVWGFAIPCV